MKDEAFSIDGNCIEQLPIPSLEPAHADPIQENTNRLMAVLEQSRAWEIDTLTRIAKVSDLGDNAGKVFGWLRRADDDFVRLVGNVCGGKPSSSAVSRLMAFRRKASDELGHFLTEQLKLEKQLAVLVEESYGLTPEERQLLRDTRPVRDPIDVLQAKLAGLDGGMEEAANE